MSETIMKYNEWTQIYRSIMDILRNYPVSPDELLSAMQTYAEWQENVGLADLSETLWMDDGTPMTPDLTRYLYHQMYGLSDIYDSEEGEDDE